jgi:hypothetical protein
MTLGIARLEYLGEIKFNQVEKEENNTIGNGGDIDT